MKLLVLLFLVGWASASSHEELSNSADEYVLSFLEGMEHAPSLAEYLGEPNSELLARVEDEIKTELGKSLKDGVDRILQKIKEAVDEGRVVKEEFLHRLKELGSKMKDLKVEIGEKSKDLLRQIKEKSKDYFNRLLDKLKINKRAADDQFEEALAELNIRDILKKIRDHLRENVDIELLKEKIEKLFGQGSELLRHLLQTLKEKGKRKLMILIDAILDEDDESDREERGIKDYWEKVKNYFKDLKIDLQEKYVKFGEWVKNVLDKGMEKSKDKMENIKAIAREFGKHAKNVSKEVAEEAKEFFKQYKEELGNVWEELKENFKEIMNRKD